MGWLKCGVEGSKEKRHSVIRNALKNQKNISEIATNPVC